MIVLLIMVTGILLRMYWAWVDSPGGIKPRQRGVR